MKEGIIEKYQSLDSVPGFQYSIEFLDYIFSKIEEKLIKRNSIDEMDTRIYIDSLKINLEEFYEMVKEVENE